MLEFVKGDLFQSSCEALVNTVNCVGIMGRGVALQFKQRYPLNFKEYEKACKSGSVVPGKMLVHATGLMIGPKWVINFPTKRHWRGASRVEDVAIGLDGLAAAVREHSIMSIAILPLGCRLGGLGWPVVKDLIMRKLSALPMTAIERGLHEWTSRKRRFDRWQIGQVDAVLRECFT